MRLKHFIATSLGFVMLFSSVIFATDTCKNITIINNQYNNIDYNVLASDTDACVETLGITEPIYLTDEGQNNLSNLSVEESYLISHEIIERPYSVVDGNCELHNYEMSDSCPKTLLYEMLYRSYSGPIVSRPLAFVDEENCSLLYTTNVYELYLQEILNKGYVDRAELNTLNGNAFLASYDKLNSMTTLEANVAWDNNLGVATAETPLVFGLSNSYSSVNNIAIKEPSYFVNEDMLTLDALTVIAQFVRRSEKDMSKLESSIIAYKYGINYIPNVTDAERADIEYLIAKGILNFEDSSEFTNLYGEFTYKDAIKLCYRIANVDARVDFSKIQLTDQESFWMNKGYFSNKMVMKQGSTLPYVQTITEEYWNEMIANDYDATGADINSNQNNSKPESNNFIDDIIGSVEVKTVFAETGDTKSFNVIKMFDISYDYLYKGIPLAELEKSKDKPDEFVSYEEKTFAGVGANNSKMAKVVFKVEAKSYDNAVLYIDNNISIKGGLTPVDIQAYTTIDDDGKEITLVSQTSMKSNFSQIAVIEDKVLVNRDTGVEAVILPEEGYALVGNRVVVSKDLIMTDTSDEVYYNLDILCTLVSNTYLSKLTDRELYICNALNNEKLVDIVGTQNNVIGKTYVSNIATVSANGVSSISKTLDAYFNIDNIDKGVNILSRKFTVNTAGNETHEVYFIVNWEYVVPDTQSLSQFLDNDFFAGDGLTMNEVNDAIYTKPTDSSLVEWWDSNISVSNSLANFMYGTTGVEYIKTGYLVPSITILRDATIDDATISAIFTSNGFKLDSVGMKYCVSTTKWWENYYSAGTMQNAEMKSLAMANRSCKILNGKKTSEGIRFETDYFVTKCGVIYQNSNSNNKVEYKLNKLYLRTRNVSGSAIPPEGTIFEYNGYKWIYLWEQKVGGKMYFVIIPAFAMPEYKDMGVVKTQKYEVLPYSDPVGVKNEDKIMLKATENYYKLYETYLDGLEHPDFSNNYTGSYLYGVDLKAMKYYEGSANVYSASWYVQGNNLSDKNGNRTSLKNNQLVNTVNNKGVVIVPRLYLPLGTFSFVADDNDYTLVNGPLVTALGMNHIFTSGVSRSVIDSIIYKHTKTIPVNSMLVNQRILIGDVMYTRTTDDNGKAVLVSDPIYNIDLVNSLKYSDYAEDTDTIKRFLFTGISVDYGGHIYYLSSFIKNATVGNLSNATNGAGILFAQNGEKRVYLDGDSKAVSVDSATPQAVCISIQLEDGLFARPTNDKQNTYVLLYVSSIMADKSVDNIPFFNESLSYREETSDYVAVSNSKFNPSSLYNSVKKSYKNMMRKAFAGDVVTIIWMFIFYFAVYFAIMAWIMYFILTLGYTRRLFEVLTVPTGKGKYLRNGFDLIKIFTFGVYNIDSEPTLARTFISSFICFFISYAIVFWHPF